MLSESVLSAAEILWNYHQMGHAIAPSDCILVLGSHDVRVAQRGADLYLQGFAPLLVMSGGLGNFTRGLWDEPEAEKFARVAQEMGVPRERILIEKESTNTGENILFTQRMLQREGVKADSFIVVQKPYMERRSYATFRKRWPDKSIRVTSPQMALRDYPNEEISMDDVIHIMVGDFQRILVYPERGYQIAQDVPDAVMAAYEELVKTGFTRHLLV